MNSSTHLSEHCDPCHGTGNTGYPLRVSCAVCGGSGRRVRHTHDARSAIDFEPPEVRSPNAPQPHPKPGTAPHSVDLVVLDLAERKAHGVAKYGVAHQFDNGRDHLVDLYQEQLDAAVYTRAEIEKRKRIVALVRVLRSPENSAPLAELLDLLDGGA